MTMTKTQRGEALVSCRALSKHYGKGVNAVRALEDCDLTVQAGELLMLVGPSGCGKTTLISIIAGILDPDSGDCEVFGRSLASLSPAERLALRRRDVGFVFQAFQLIPALDCASNVAVPLLIQGVAQQKARAQAVAALAQVGLADRANSLPSELSGGQQQRVAIARAIVHQPRLIVCDEPTSALDHDNGQRALALLKSIAVQHDRALVVVTHDNRILPFADRIARMDDGRVVDIQTPAVATI